MTKMLRTYLTALLVLVILSGTAAWFFRFRHEVTLIDLQKQYLLSKTPEGKEQVIDRLEDYYLNLEVPDSIHQRVDDAVQVQLDTAEIDLGDWSDGIFEEPNPYELENKLQKLLKTAMIAKAREEEHTFDALMGAARKMAEIVDKRTENDYWVGFVDGMSQYAVGNAVAWLKADMAAMVCKSLVDSNYIEAEIYGSLGLKNLLVSKDERIRLNVMQRLQVILYLFRGLNDLSIAIVERNLQDVYRIDDPLRMNGIRYYKAEALRQNGQIVEAMEVFHNVDQESERHSKISSMLWYKKNALIQTAMCYWDLGEFEQALFICDSIAKLSLSVKDKTQLHNTRGLIYRRLGNYESAKAEYEKGLRFAVEHDILHNEIRILKNIGNLYSDLTEFDMALKYLKRGKTKLIEANPDDLVRRINFAIDISKVLLRKNPSWRGDSLINEAMQLLNKLGNFPNSQADLLATIATINQQIGSLENALSNITEAENICERNGLYRMSLTYKIRMAQLYIDLNNIDEARDKIKEALRKAEDIGYAEMKIAALALLADIEQKEGNTDNARTAFSQLHKVIEYVMSGLENNSLVMSFQQKIYQHLKNEIVFEIQKNQINSALTKLALAKSRLLRKHTNKKNGVIFSTNGLSQITRLKNTIDNKSLIIDYLVTYDSLYVFVLQRGCDTRVFRRSINLQRLKEQVKSYEKTIANTATQFRNYDVASVNKYFQETMQLSQALYDSLLGWFLSRKQYRLVNKIYVIPDDFLFKLPVSTLVRNESDKYMFLAEKISVVYSSSLLHLTRYNKDTVQSDLKNKKVLVSVDTKIPGAGEFLRYLQDQFSGVELLTTGNKHTLKLDVLESFTREYDMLIILGHGEGNPVFPEQSYIDLAVLNKKNHQVKNVRITLADLESIEWQGAEMVMLIGCETGDGKPYRGTGIAGLQQGFLSLGAKQVLASLWKIDAGHTISQMTSFFNNWYTSTDPAVALQKMSQTYVRNLYQHPVYKQPHPYLWGSYMLYSQTTL